MSLKLKVRHLNFEDSEKMKWHFSRQIPIQHSFIKIDHALKHLNIIIYNTHCSNKLHNQLNVATHVLQKLFYFQYLSNVVSNLYYIQVVICTTKGNRVHRLDWCWGLWTRSSLRSRSAMTPQVVVVTRARRSLWRSSRRATSGRRWQLMSGIG